jgi:hypothetical protein
MKCGGVSSCGLGLCGHGMQRRASAVATRLALSDVCRLDSKRVGDRGIENAFAARDAPVAKTLTGGSLRRFGRTVGVRAVGALKAQLWRSTTFKPVDLTLE